MDTKLKPRQIITWTASIAFTCTLVVISSYLIIFRNGNISRDVAVWGQFGDYIGGILNPLFALLNLTIFAYVAITFQKINDREKKADEESEDRIKIVLELHREWNEQSNYRSRAIAGRLVRLIPNTTVLKIEENCSAEEVVHIWIVIGFFLRLNYLVEHEKVHKKMTAELFGELFTWWWVVSFEKQLAPVDWEASDQIKNLKNWLFSVTTELQRAPWVRRATVDLNAALLQAEKHSNNQII